MPLASGFHVHAEQLPISTYTTAEGLAHDRVLRIVRDAHGFLWFCTREGLSRFDGYHFTTYGTEHGLSNPFVSDLLVTRRDVYWVATQGGLYRFSTSTDRALIANGRPKSRFTLYPLGDQPQAYRVNALYEDHIGRIWAGTDGGLFRLDETSTGGTFQPVELNVGPHRNVGVMALAGDQEGNLWIGTIFGLVRRLPDGRMVHYATPLDFDLIWAVLQDRDGRLWAGHDMGLCMLIPEPASDRYSFSGPVFADPMGAKHRRLSSLRRSGRFAVV